MLESFDRFHPLCSQLSIEERCTPISQTATLLKEGVYHSCASWETFENVQNSWNLGRLLLRLYKTIVGSNLCRGKVSLIYYLALIYFYLLMFAKVKRTVYLFALIKMNEKKSFQESCILREQILGINNKCHLLH